MQVSSKRSSMMKGGGKHSSGYSLNIILSHFFVGIGGIYIGLMMGMYTCPSMVDVSSVAVTQQQEERILETPLKNQTMNQEQLKFPKTLSKIAVDYATVPRDDFNELLEIGVPLDDTQKGAEDVYQVETAIKWSMELGHYAVIFQGDGEPAQQAFLNAIQEGRHTRP